MIKGEFADGNPIDSVSLKKSFFLLNAAVEASIKLLIDLKNLDENLIAIVIETNNNKETIII